MGPWRTRIHELQPAAIQENREWAPAFTISAALVLLRLVFLPLTDLFPEEAYYWCYARHLDLSYLDHPPLVAWLIYLGTALLGDTELGVRLFAIISSLVASFFIFRLTDLFHGRHAAWIAVLLLQVLPFFFMIGFMMTPDAPLTACWAGALYFLARAAFSKRRLSWLGVGICMGLGMLSKYTIGLVGVAALAFLLVDRPARIWWRRCAPYGSVLLGIALFTPVLWWNATHDWASFAFQSADRVSQARRFSTHELFGSILALLTPLGALLALQALFPKAPRAESAVRRVGAARRLVFAQVFTVVPLAVFILYSLFHRVKLNWTGPLWLAAIPCVAALIVRLFDGSGRLMQRGAVATLVLLVISYAALSQYLVSGLPGLGYSANIDLLPVGWPELGRALEQRKTELRRISEKCAIVGLDRNFIAAEATFYQADRARSLRETTGRHLFGEPSLMYEYWFPPRSLNGAALLLVSFERKDFDDPRIAARCETLGPIEEAWLQRGGKRICPYYTQVAVNYRSEAGREVRRKAHPLPR